MAARITGGARRELGQLRSTARQRTDMNFTHTTSLRTALALLACALALLALSSCGGSSKGSTSANASGTAATATRPGAGGRFAALRECLRHNGVTLPQRKPGSVGGVLRGRGLPPGVTAAQFEAALKKCGSTLAGRRLAFPALRGLNLKSARFKAALTRFGACMREHGIALPAPNTSGKGPVFSTAGVNTRSAKFLTAEAICRRVLAGG
jgi:hypothetical protein